MAFEYDPRIETIAGSLAWSAIRNDPWGFFKIASSTYIAKLAGHIAGPCADVDLLPPEPGIRP